MGGFGISLSQGLSHIIILFCLDAVVLLAGQLYEEDFRVLGYTGLRARDNYAVPGRYGTSQVPREVPGSVRGRERG